MPILAFIVEKRWFILAGLLMFAIIVGIFITITSRQKPSPPSSKKQTQPVLLPPAGSYVPDELIIKYTPGNSPEELEEAAAKRKPWELFNDPGNRLKELEELDKKAGVLLKEKMFASNDPNLQSYYLLTLPYGTNLIEIQKLYLEHAFIEYTNVDTVMQAFAVPSDPAYTQMWNLSKIQMGQAWDIAKGANTVKVAVVDTGIDYTHEDFQGKTIRGSDFSTCAFFDESTGSCTQSKLRDDDPMDDNGHGTHIAGTIGAVTDNGKGIAGINWQVTLLAVKVLNAHKRGKTADILDGIQYAVGNGAKVINLSLGNRLPCSREWQDTINNARQHNSVIVAAAGNDGKDTIDYSPASCSGVINVSATDESDQRAIFSINKGSNYGARIDIAAPGKNILSLWAGNIYQSDSGTSMAAPHVAGVAALLLAANPSLTPQLVQDCLVNNADHISTDLPIGKRLNAYNSLLGCPPSTPTPSPTPNPTPTNRPTSGSTCGSTNLPADPVYTGQPSCPYVTGAGPAGNLSCPVYYNALSQSYCRTSNQSTTCVRPVCGIRGSSNITPGQAANWWGINPVSTTNTIVCSLYPCTWRLKDPGGNLVETRTITSSPNNFQSTNPLSTEGVWTIEFEGGYVSSGDFYNGLSNWICRTTAQVGSSTCPTPTPGASYSTPTSSTGYECFEEPITPSPGAQPGLQLKQLICRPIPTPTPIPTP